MDEVEHSNFSPRRHNPFLNVEVEMDTFDSGGKDEIIPAVNASVHVTSLHIPMSI